MSEYRLLPWLAGEWAWSNWPYEPAPSYCTNGSDWVFVEPADCPRPHNPRPPQRFKKHRKKRF